MDAGLLLTAFGGGRYMYTPTLGAHCNLFTKAMSIFFPIRRRSIRDVTVFKEQFQHDNDAFSGLEKDAAEVETGNGVVEDTEGGGVDNADIDEGGDKVGDDDKSGSDGEEDNEEEVFMHAPMTERKRQKEFEIFVGGLDREAVEEDLIKVFGEFGEIQVARIVKNPATQKSKGFGFIRYTTIEQAKKVLADYAD